MNQVVSLSEQSLVLPPGHGFKLPGQVPLGIRPNFERTGDAVADGAHDLMNEAAQAAERALTAARAIHGDLTLTAHGQHVQSKQLTSKILEGYWPRYDKVRDKLKSEQETLRKTVVSPPKPADAKEQLVVIEVARGLRDLSERERQKVISAAIKAGEDVVVQAALGMPGLCTGLSGQLKESAQKEWAITRYPHQFERLERLEKIEAELERSGGLLSQFNHSLYGAAMATEGEKAERAKQAALKGIG